MTIMFLSLFLSIKRNNVIFYLCNFLFDVDQNAQFSLLTYLRRTQFSYTEIGNFSDDFMFEQEVQFLSDGYFAFSVHATEIQIVPIYTARFPWSETKKI